MFCSKVSQMYNWDWLDFSMHWTWNLSVPHVTIGVVSQFLLQLHPPLLQFIQQLFQLRHLPIDVLCRDVLV